MWTVKMVMVMMVVVMIPAVVMMCKHYMASMAMSIDTNCMQASGSG